MANQLTDLEIHEVSLVRRGAIGEVFTVIKSEDPINKDIDNTVSQTPEGWYIYDEDGTVIAGPFKTQDEANMENMARPSDGECLGNTISKATVSEMCDKLTNMPDSEFMSVMSNMMQKYKKINSSVNKGGLNNMGPEEIKSLVAEVLGTAMDSVNKNFSSINKSIDEIQKKLTAEEEQKLADEKAKQENAVAKSISDIGEVVKTLTESLASVSEQVKKMAELEGSISEITKKVEALGSQENPSNGGTSSDEVNKSGDNKEVFWKSFVAPKE